MSTWVDWDALWRVAALSAAFGVGAVGLYALGVAAVTAAEGATVGRVRKAAGIACFVVCLAVVAFGIQVMLDK
ncbi:MAG: hypothetical protein AB7V62_09535 [Thermoleophilia bacterium]